ncbi:MAG: sulfite exporter TauE/SafE family protein [Alphaproteobacteria bacterium]
MHVDTSFLIPAVFALVIAGALAGFLSGLLGVGGGIVTVPVMFEIFRILDVDSDVRMHVAVATSLATIIPTSIMSARSHHKRGAVDFGLLRVVGPTVLVGVLIGAVIADYLKGDVLTAVFGAVALVVAFYMFFRRDSWRLGPEFPRGVGGAAIGTTTGFLSTLMGIGGGTLGVPAMTLFNVPVHRAVGTCSAIGLIIGVPGAIGYVISGWGHPDLPPFSIGYVNILACVLLLPTILAVVPYGAKVAHSIGKEALQRVFGVFLLIVAVRMITSLL